MKKPKLNLDQQIKLKKIEDPDGIDEILNRYGSEEEESDENALTIWKIVDSINSKTPYEWEEIEKLYNPYIINKAMSYFHDSISYADDMNRYYDIPKNVQYNYLINTIRAKKRYTKWAKKDIDIKLIESIRSYFGYNMRKAEDALKILTPEDIKMIQKKQETGGIK